MVFGGMVMGASAPSRDLSSAAGPRSSSRTLAPTVAFLDDVWASENNSCVLLHSCQLGCIFWGWWGQVAHVLAAVIWCTLLVVRHQSVSPSRLPHPHPRSWMPSSVPTPYPLRCPPSVRSLVLCEEDGIVCSGNGVCTNTLSPIGYPGGGVCQCTPPYAPPNCSTISCDCQHGTCVAPDSAGKADCVRVTVVPRRSRMCEPLSPPLPSISLFLSVFVPQFSQSFALRM
jgi:hypothetical protein